MPYCPRGCGRKISKKRKDGYVLPQSGKLRKETLTTEECWEVAEYSIKVCDRMPRDLNLRILPYSLAHRCQWKYTSKEVHWHTLVESDLRQKATPRIKSRAEIDEEHDIEFLKIFARADITSVNDKIKLWNEATEHVGRMAWNRRVRKFTMM